MSNQPLTENDKRLKFVPVEKAIVPPDGIIYHYKDRWWLVHPTKGLLFFRGTSPQCNSNKEITERLHWIAPWSEVKFFPSIFIRINPRDYVS